MVLGISQASLSTLQDMRYLQGAPRAWETVSAVEPSCKEFLADL